MKTQWQQYLKLMKQEIVPALGCTEPLTVALAAAKCRQLLGGIPDWTEISVTPNLYKNGMGVTVPGTGMLGLPIAAAVGITGGLADAGLEVLRALTAEQIKLGKALMKSDSIAIELHTSDDVLLTVAKACRGRHQARVVIEKNHDNFTHLSLDGIELTPQQRRSASRTQDDSPDLNLKSIYDFATRAPVAELAFIEAAAQLNSDLSELGIKGGFGLELGTTLQRQVDSKLLGDDLLTRAMRLSSAASDARMGGAMLPAMSNSGSGNQGISATMPVVACVQILDADRESLIRALAMSHLLAIYIKRQQNKLSALCAGNTAAMGAGAAITWLLGGTLQQIDNCIRSMVGDVSGIICDGAKAGCSTKLATGAASAVKSALIALNGNGVTEQQGIVEKNADLCIRNLGQLSRGGMADTDQQIIQMIRRKATATVQL